jgi:hypothetical protein
MATPRTEITEIVTGLGMLGFASLDHAITVRPALVRNVEAAHFARLEAEYANGAFGAEFAIAWANGAAFARSVDGLRGRPPWQVEWKGPHKPPGYEQIPADLRVDHVYLISCKYGSTILHNVSPAHLFDRHLAERRGDRDDWYAVVAPEAYQELYAACRGEVADASLPAQVTALRTEHRHVFKALPRTWSAATAEPYRELVRAVSVVSAQRWNDSLHRTGVREEFLWRLLRLQPSPYFVLGATGDGEPLRYRVTTPWDFRARFAFRAFDAWPHVVGQPIVRWRAVVIDRTTRTERVVDGHVEIRWSHGRFSGAPEAKVHLDTHPHVVAGYEALAG